MMLLTSSRLSPPSPPRSRCFRHAAAYATCYAIIFHYAAILIHAVYAVLLMLMPLFFFAPYFAAITAHAWLRDKILIYAMLFRFFSPLLRYAGYSADVFFEARCLRLHATLR